MCCRPQGISWALKHVRESQQAEATSKALEPQVVDPETHEAAPETSEAASESVSRSPEAPRGTAEPADKLYITSDEEENAITYFFDQMDQIDREREKRYDKMEESAALRELLQEKPTGLMTVYQTTLVKAAVALHELLLPFTALHLLNVTFPGAAGTALILLCGSF